MKETLKKIQEFCERRNCDLVIRHYGYREVCFMGINDTEEEIFTVAIWYPPNQNRQFYIEIDSQKEQWTGGQFSKDEILLLLSLDDFNDDDLGIKPQTTSEATK